MIAALLNPAFTGTDLALVVLALIAAYLGDRYDRKRNHNLEES